MKRPPFPSLSAAKLPHFLTPPAPLRPLSDQAWPVVEATLENGMKVRLLEDHAIGACAMEIFFGVGSKDELPGQTGISHFLEHMMFNGTPRVGPGQFDRILEENGGESNAFTSRDVTAYETAFPKNALKQVLTLESDRMQGLALVPNLVASERDVVLEERRVSTEESIEGRLSDALFDLAFSTHPYRIPVIGYEQDIQRLDGTSCRDHFLRHYAPNNATLWLVGDFNAQKALKLIEENFGKIPPFERDAPPIDREPEQTKERRCVVTFPAHAESILVGYRGPSSKDRDAPLANLIAAMLTGRPGSRLTKEFVYGKGVAAGAVADFSWYKDPGLFTIQLDLTPGLKGEDVLEELDAFLDRICSEGFTDDELEIALMDSRSSLVRVLSTIQGRCDYLGMCEAYTGDWRTAFEDDRRVSEASREEIRAFAQGLFDTKNRSVVFLKCGDRTAGVCESNGADEETDLDAMTSPENALSPDLHEAAQDAQMGGLTAESEGTANCLSDDVSQDKTEAKDHLTPLPAMVAPTFEERTLKNGLKIAAARHGSVPQVALHVSFGVGSVSDPLGLEGCASFTMAMLRRGTTKLSANELDDAFVRLGTSVGGGSAEEFSTFFASCPTQSFVPMVQLTHHVLTAPAFDDSEISAAKGRALANLQISLDDPAVLVDLALARAAFGSDHPFGHWGDGTLKTIENLQRDDLVAMARRIISPDRMVITVAGDLDPTFALDTLEELFGQMEVTHMPPQVIPPLTLEEPSILVVHVPESTQARVKLANRVPGLLSNDRRAIAMAAYVLGGGFTSRLMAKVRVEKGLTYGISATVPSNATVGAFSVASFTKNDSVRDLVDTILDETRRFREQGLRPGELNASKTSLCGAMPFSFETASQIASGYNSHLRLGRPKGSFGQGMTQFMALTETDVMAAANNWLFTRPVSLALAGDSEAIVPSLQGLPGKITVLDRDELLMG